MDMKLTHVHVLFFGKQNVKPLRREKANSQKYKFSGYSLEFHQQTRERWILFLPHVVFEHRIDVS